MPKRSRTVPFAALTRGLWTCAALALLALPSTAWANANDLRLIQLDCAQADTLNINGGIDQPEHAHFGRLNCPVLSERQAYLQSQFKKLSTEMAQAMSQHMTAPSDTVGFAGWEMSYQLNIIDINDDAEYWRVTEDNLESYVPTDSIDNKFVTGADPVLVVHSFSTHKGLPFSFQLGGGLNYLQGSRMFTVGGDLSWSYNEGFYYIPDFSARIGVNRLVGSNELSLTMLDSQFGISKAFAIGGSATLTPYLSYSLLAFQAASGIVDPSPYQLQDQDNDFVFDTVGFGDALTHRMAIGLRFVSYVFLISGHAVIPVDSPAGVPVYTFKFGLQY